MFRDRKEKQGDEAGKISMTLRRYLRQVEGFESYSEEMPAEEEWLKRKETRDLCFRRFFLELQGWTEGGEGDVSLKVEVHHDP